MEFGRLGFIVYSVFGVIVFSVGVFLLTRVTPYAMTIEFRLVETVVLNTTTVCRADWTSENRTCYTVDRYDCTGTYSGYANGRECVFDDVSKTVVVLAAVLFTIGTWTLLTTLAFCVLKSNGIVPEDDNSTDVDWE